MAHSPGAGLYSSTNKPNRSKKKLRQASQGGGAVGPRVDNPDKTPYAWVSEGNTGLIDTQGNAIVVRNF